MTSPNPIPNPQQPPVRTGHTASRFPMLPVRTACLAAAALLSAACTARFTSQRFVSAPEGSFYTGTVYKLPKSVIRYKVDFALYRKKAGGNTSHFIWLDDKEPAEGSGPVTLTSRMIGNDERMYVINTNDLNAFNVLTKDAGFSVNEDGVLAGANADFQDQTTDIVENIVSSGLKIAKIMTPMGTARTAADGDGLEKIAVLPVSGEIDCAARLRDAGGPAIVVVPTASVMKHAKEMWGVSIKDVPDVRITIHPPSAPGSLGASERPPRGWKYRKDTDKQNGIWIQHPGRARVVVDVAGSRILDERILLADAGPVTLLPISSKIGTDRTAKIEFHTGTGNLKSHNSTSTSQGKKLTESAGNIIDNVGTELPAILPPRTSGTGARNAAPVPAPLPAPAAGKEALDSIEAAIQAKTQLGKALEKELETLGREPEPADEKARKELIERRQEKQQEIEREGTEILELRMKAEALRLQLAPNDLIIEEP